MAKSLTPKSSPLVFIIPFAVMFAAIAIVLMTIGNKQDIRGRASNDSQQTCVALCKQHGGNTANCGGLCTDIRNGTMTCQEAADELNTSSQGFMTICQIFTPGANYCENKCHVDSGATGTQQARQGLCKNVCNAVVKKGQTCDQACGALPTAAQSYREECLRTCATFKTPTPAVSGTITPTPTGTGQGGGMGQLNCQSKCKSDNQIVRSSCLNVCNGINAGTLTCPTACNSVENSTARQLCKMRLCPAN